MGSESDQQPPWGWQGPTEYPTSQLPPTHPTQVLTPPPPQPYGRLSDDEPNPKSAFGDFLRRNATVVAIVVAAAVVMLALLVAAIAGTVMAISAVRDAQQTQQRSTLPTRPEQNDPFGFWTDPDQRTPQSPQDPWDQLFPQSPDQSPLDPFGQMPQIPGDPYGDNNGLDEDYLNDLLRQFEQQVPEELRDTPEWRQFFGNP